MLCVLCLTVSLAATYDFSFSSKSRKKYGYFFKPRTQTSEQQGPYYLIPNTGSIYRTRFRYAAKRVRQFLKNELSIVS
jgi:hypothetical protein